MLQSLSNFNVAYFRYYINIFLILFMKFCNCKFDIIKKYYSLQIFLLLIYKEDFSN